MEKLICRNAKINQVGGGRLGNIYFEIDLSWYAVSKRIWSVSRLGSSLLTFSCNLQAPCSDHQCRGNREEVASDSSTPKHTESSFSMNVVSLKFTKGFQKRDTAALKHTHTYGVIFMTHNSQSWTVMLRQRQGQSFTCIMACNNKAECSHSIWKRLLQLSVCMKPLTAKPTKSRRWSHQCGSASWRLI